MLEGRKDIPIYSRKITPPIRNTHQVNPNYKTPSNQLPKMIANRSTAIQYSQSKSSFAQKSIQEVSDQNDVERSQIIHRVRPSNSQPRLSRSTIVNRSIKNLPTNQTQQSELLQQAFNNIIVKDSDDFDEIISTPYDKEILIILEYRHKCQKNYELVNKERIYNFIYEKKLKNKMKYSAKSKINQSALPVARGSVSIMLNVSKKTYGFNLQSFKNKIPQRSKFKMKWKTIQWLLTNRADAIKQIFQNYGLLIKFARNNQKGMNRSEFSELLSYVGLGADPNLADKLFLSIFDEDSSGTVDYKELVSGLEVFREDTIEEKIQVFFDLCDQDENGNLTQKEVYEVLKANVFNQEDKIKLKKVIAQIFQQCDQNNDGLLDKKEILEASKNNPNLRQIFEESIRNVKQIDQMIENDLEEPFYTWVPVSANFVNYKEGIHFPRVNRIMKALEEFENIWYENKKKKALYKQDQTKINDQKEEDSVIEDA